jgi:predicted O-methyltransferase YrrM
MCILDPRNKILGFGMQQTWSALFMLDKVIRDNPDIKRVVEIGTLSGGVSLLFGMLMKERSGKVLTFDISTVSLHPDSLEAFKIFNVEFCKQDALKEESVTKVTRFIENERALIFCDGGSKKDEIALYTDVVKPGDLLMGHDFMTELFETDLSDETLATLDVYQMDSFNVLMTRIMSFIKCDNRDSNRATNVRTQLFENNRI